MGGAGHSPKVRSILELSLGLAESVVLSGQLKLAHVESKLRMDVGGLTRQCLRLGTDSVIWLLLVEPHIADPLKPARVENKESCRFRVHIEGIHFEILPTC